MDGFSLAFGEITLVLFTTLAPSGALAYLIMGLPVLVGRAQGEAARRLNQWSCLPLVIAMVGLIASATHLGNPSNALYVFTGVGRSPLSTEVFAAVIFLALAGVFWLYSFAEHPRVGLQRGLLAAIDVAIVAFVSSVAFAYNVDTIVTWSLPLVPASLILNALFGGPLLALAGFALASRGLGAAPTAELPIAHAAPEGASKAQPAVAHVFPSRRGARILLALATTACAANVAVYAVLGFQLQGIENELVSAADLVAGYPVYLAAFAVLAASALAFAWCAAIKRELRQSPAPLVVASVLAFVAIFLMRFTFYMSHLTVGLGV
ncbi:dimethyl sulfoxide reductase anchor subunit [Adlercreutzia equolifaciens]|uniref:dimethyl sulfoxide reductase anchor subunit family protein n=1 Tax=Adlercreutzia rubneri TaxID=2916441 RepID=UPI001D07EEC6|nr:dimethyl sulfoxide reductase anchor subunit [Adlercreutzia equolifaciens]MCB6975742.1 dimethyl sulfoxide reductase anchor subunit [Adlercreutzia equolifaciens]MDE8683886.1 dimethyl sulfoxide reductase anchor subunit [Adlercreutzia rubneri]